MSPIIETLDKLVEHFQEHIVGRSFADARKALQDNLRAVRKRLLDEHNAFVMVAETVSQAQARVKGWTDVPNKWSSVGAGLQETWRQARAAFRDAAAAPCRANLHEWRKQVKYLRFQFEALRPLWPERMEELLSEADRLGDMLGDDHRRAELEQEALLLGERFFQDSARELARRLKGYWKTWRGPASPTQVYESLPAPM